MTRGRMGVQRNGSGQTLLSMSIVASFPRLDFHKETRSGACLQERLDPARVHRVRMPSPWLSVRTLALCQDAFLVDEHGVFCLRRDALPQFTLESNIIPRLSLSRTTFTTSESRASNNG